MGDDYLFGRPDESNDERLWREAREGLERRLRTRGVKRGEKAPRAVVQEAFADYVRGFMESNPGVDETFEVVFEDIFAGLEDQFVLYDEAKVEDDGDGAKPPKRARCDELVAADLSPAESSLMCKVAVGAARAMAVWPQIVEAGLDDVQKLGRGGADAALTDLFKRHRVILLVIIFVIKNLCHKSFPIVSTSTFSMFKPTTFAL